MSRNSKYALGVIILSLTYLFIYVPTKIKQFDCSHPVVSQWYKCQMCGAMTDPSEGWGYSAHDNPDTVWYPVPEYRAFEDLDSATQQEIKDSLSAKDGDG